MKIAAIVIFILALHVIFVGLHWQYTWDDSAITLAFSRTLVATGEIRPTPLSDRVEGYSTFLWMCLMTLPSLLGLDASQLLFSAKLLTVLLNSINTLFIGSLI